MGPAEAPLGMFTSTVSPFLEVAASRFLTWKAKKTHPRAKKTQKIAKIFFMM